MENRTLEIVLVERSRMRARFKKKQKRWMINISLSNIKRVVALFKEELSRNLSLLIKR